MGEHKDAKTYHFTSEAHKAWASGIIREQELATKLALMPVEEAKARLIEAQKAAQLAIEVSARGVWDKAQKLLKDAHGLELGDDQEVRFDKDGPSVRVLTARQPAGKPPVKKATKKKTAKKKPRVRR